ncbi:hypothetical protein P171DRAFT_7734 [Karstenula rhodostoma CBS 690.94]|uniref:Uncharacterized protein n=1 Tax=Karstenula rhodostoma CBS 690.94 TaxID=1392251 RepID=A0A9P4UIU3_9PLEO|nr:hypothetical protein P171DRAFT_7734 [Karstenula rhodostoma CBS 690.94]
MTWQFITNDIGPKERRLIRSHVMTGKNAGRPRPSHRKKRDAATQQITSQHAVTHKQDRMVPQRRTQDLQRSNLFDRLVCNDLAFAEIPQQSTKSIELLRQWLSLIDRRLYPPEFCSRLDFMDYVWLQYVFYDEGYMHGVLAIKASFRNYLETAKASPDALEHLSRAYKLTQRRLAGPEAISDKAIAGVTILAIYQLVHGNVDIGLVHFDGLCRMVGMRGGLAKLMEHNRALAQKPWRIDLEFALQSGLPMRFGGAEVPLPATKTMNPRFISPTYTKLCDYGIDIELVCMLSDTTAFTNSLNTINELSRLDPLDFSEQAFQLIHRLIDFASLQGKRPIHPLEDLLQVTLLAIMTTSLPNYTTDQLHYELLANHMKRAIMRYVATTDRDSKLLLWAIFVGRVSILHHDQDDWIGRILLQASQQAQIHEWAQIQRILSRYCWIHTLHDTVAMRIWEKFNEKRAEEERRLRVPFRAQISGVV